jgi:hypothetical protein
MTLQDRRRSLCAVIVFVLAVLMPSMARASASRLGHTFNASGAIAVGSKVNDIAYDPVNDVYLIVSGPEKWPVGYVYGRFIQGDGTPLGPATFRIPQTLAFTQLPRVAYSAALGGFLVVWIDQRAHVELAQVWGRYVRYSPGGTPAFVTDDFLIDHATGGAKANRHPAVGCAGAKAECLAAWVQVGQAAGEMFEDVHAVRLDHSGQRLGTEYFLSNDNNWQFDPSIGYDPTTGVYVVLHSVYSQTGSIWAHRIQAESGTHQGITVLAEGGDLSRPEMALNTHSGQFLATWYDEVTRAHFGRFFKSDGAPTSDIITLARGTSGVDGNTIAYNASSNSFFSVTNGGILDNIGWETSGIGVPSDVFQVTAIGGGGNFYPRIAAHGTRSEWLMTSSSSHAFVAGQRITTDTQGPGGPGNPGNPGGETELIDLSPTGAPNGSWFLAEGIAQPFPGFTTFYLIVNENAEPVNVRAYFSRNDGKTFSRTFAVAAHARKTLNLAVEIGGEGIFGTVFQSLTPGLDIFVERSVYWGPTMEGSTAEAATKSLAFEWYFGEGSRNFFNNYYLLFNPNQVGGSATFTFFLENGTQVERSVDFGPQQRVTMDANGMDLPELAGQNFGVRVKATVPVVAERAMYFGLGPDGLFIGGTASVGAPGLANHWLFAEGSAAPDFHTFYLLMNPNPFPISVTRTFFMQDGSQLVGEVTVDPGSRKTVSLHKEVGDTLGAAAHFSSNDVFIAERSTYWGNPTWVEGTNAIGSTVTASDWHVPEGTETGDFDSYLLILNPTANTVTTDIVLFVEGKGRFTAPLELRPVIAPNSRLTIHMRDFLRKMEQAGGFEPDYLAETSFSTRVKSTGGEGIVVEHVLYRMLDGANRWRAGSAAFGVPR